MENIEIYIGVFIALTVIFIIVFMLNNNEKKPSVDMDEIIKLFKKDDIIGIEFVRNKIVVNFKDVTKFNLKLLHSTYAKGITVVGDKIKFYVSDDSKINEEVFNSIKKFIGR